MPESPKPTEPIKSAYWICRGPTLHRTAFSLLMLLHILLLSDGLFRHFPNVDEIGHLPAGISHWKYNQFDMYRVNPPLVRAVAGLPAWCSGVEYDWRYYTDAVGRRPEFHIGVSKLNQSKLGLQPSYILPRIACLIFPCLGLWLLFSWTTDTLGPAAGIAVSVFWCFSPNILAHGQCINPDVGAIATGIWACHRLWRHFHHQTLPTAILAGIAIGLALLAKLTWVTLVVSLPLALLLVNLLVARRYDTKSLLRWGGQYFLIGCIAVGVLNYGYLFEGSFAKLGSYDFCSEMLGGDGCSDKIHGNRFRGSWMEDIPVIVPRNFLLGIDYLKFEVEDKRWSFLLGEWRHGSWRHYYLLTTLMKTPSPTLLASVLGLIVFMVAVVRGLASSRLISMVIILSTPAIVSFISVSLQGGFNHHHRYVLPIYPPMFVLASLLASPLARQIFVMKRRGPKNAKPENGSDTDAAQPDSNEESSKPEKADSSITDCSRAIHRHWPMVLAMSLAIISSATSLYVHPHYLSYFNQISGGPEKGWHKLGFSNIDWGQDLLIVDQWIQAHPECGPLSFSLDYFNADAEFFGLPYSAPPHLPKNASIDEVRTDKTQWWIISVKSLYNLPGEPGLEYLQQLEPFDKIAYSYHVYRIAPAGIEVPTASD